MPLETIDAVLREMLTALHLKCLHKSKCFRCFCLDYDKQVGDTISPLCFDVLKLGRFNSLLNLS